MASFQVKGMQQGSVTTVHSNPSSSTLQRIAPNTQRRARGFIDSDGTVWIWPSKGGTHRFMYFKLRASGDVTKLSVPFTASVERGSLFAHVSSNSLALGSNRNINKAGDKLYSNPRIRKMLGWPAEENTGSFESTVLRRIQGAHK